MTDESKGGWSLMPPPPGTCELCAVAHEPEAPHNAQSLFYQYRFFGTHGRWPTWADAVSHCEPTIAAMWRTALEERQAWTEPADGAAAIAELARVAVEVVIPTT